MSQGAVFDSQRGELRVSCIEYEGQVLEAWLTRLPSGQFKLNKTTETSEDCLGARTTASREGDADIPYVKISGKKPQKAKLQRADSGDWVYDLVNLEDTGAGRLVVQFGKQSDTRKKPDNVGNNGNGNNSDKLKGNAAPQDITAAILKVRAVEITGGGNGRQVIGGAREVDLLNVVNGGIEGLADIVLPEGRFGQLRLILEEGSYVIADGENYDLNVPSGEQSGLKIHGDWGVEGGMITRMELDFSVNDIRFNKAQGYRIKPTVKVTAVETAVMPVEPPDGPENDTTETPESGNEGEEDDVTPPSDKSFMLITEDGGLTFELPAGAHPDPSILYGEMAGIGLMSPIYELGPDGTEFSQDGTITISYDETQIPEGYTEQNMVILQDGLTISSTVNVDENTVSVEIGHFSCYAGVPVHECNFIDIDYTDPNQDWFSIPVSGLCKDAVVQGYPLGDGTWEYIPGQDANLLETLKVFLSTMPANCKRYIDENSVSNIVADAESILNIDIIESDLFETITREKAITYLANMHYSYFESDAIDEMQRIGVTDGTRLDEKLNRAELARLAYNFISTDTCTGDFCDIPVTLSSPIKNAGISQTGVEFRWEPIPDATKYQIVISQESNFSSFFDDGENSTCSYCFTETTTEPYFSKDMSFQDITYYWKVRADNSDWSATGSFRTMDNSSILPLLNGTVSTHDAELFHSQKVRVIYLIPSDRQVNTSFENAIKYAVLNIQDWYLEQLSFEKTFSLIDPDNIVETHVSSHNAIWYSSNNADTDNWNVWYNAFGDVETIIGKRPNDETWIIYVDANRTLQQCSDGHNGGGGSLGQTIMPADDLHGLIGNPGGIICKSSADSNVWRWVGGLAHEGGHSFGLPHPEEKGFITKEEGDSYVMETGYQYYPGVLFTDEGITTLNKSEFFSSLPIINFVFNEIESEKGLSSSDTHYYDFLDRKVYFRRYSDNRYLVEDKGSIFYVENGNIEYIDDLVSIFQEQGGKLNPDSADYPAIDLSKN